MPEKGWTPKDTMGIGGKTPPEIASAPKSHHSLLKLLKVSVYMPMQMWLFCNIRNRIHKMRIPILDIFIYIMFLLTTSTHYPHIT